MHHDGGKHRAVEPLSRLRTKEEEKAVLGDEVLVLAIPQETFACVSRTDISDLEFIKERKGPFVLLITEVFMMAGTTDDEKA